MGSSLVAWQEGGIRKVRQWEGANVIFLSGCERDKRAGKQILSNFFG